MQGILSVYRFISLIFLPLTFFMILVLPDSVRDTGFAEALRASLVQEIEHNAQQVSHSTWRKHGLWTRLLMRASYAAVRFLTGVTGYMRSRDDV